MAVAVFATAAVNEIIVLRRVRPALPLKKRPELLVG